MNSDIKHIAILVNPQAGSGRGIKLSQKVISIIEHQPITYQLFSDNWPPHFNSFTDIWIVGGDGTLNYFINRYPDIQLPLVLFKGGSGNDFYWLLYGSKNLEQMIETAFSAYPQKVDAGSCNGRLFLNCAGAGFDGVVVKNLMGKNKKQGKASFYKEVIKNIFFYKEQHYYLDSKPTSINGNFLIVSIMNGKRAGGGFTIAPQADISDGQLEITLIEPLNILKRLRYLPVIEKGRHGGLPFIRSFQSAKLQLSSDQLMHVQLDGEYYSSKNIQIELLPGKFLFRY